MYQEWLQPSNGTNQMVFVLDTADVDQVSINLQLNILTFILKLKAKQITGDES